MQNMDSFLSYYNQRKKALLKMENWANRLNCGMEDELWNLTISHKVNTQPWVSTRGFNYTQAWAQVMGNGHTNGACLNWRSPSRLKPECQGSHGSALPPVFVGAPLVKGKTNPLIDLALIVFTQTAIAPFERVKLLMQNQNVLIQSGRLSQPYKGIFNCFARTIRNEGFISLWRGNAALVTGICSCKVISFAFISYAKSQVGHWDYGGALALSGISAALLFVPYPLIYAETRLANDIKTTCKGGKWQFNGIIDIFRKTLKSDGIVGLYRGYIIGLIGGGMTSTVNRRLFVALQLEEMLQLLGLQVSGGIATSMTGAKSHILAGSVVGWGIAACGLAVTYPMDTIHKRMMMTSGEAIKYKDASDAFAQIFKNEGFKSFYKGAGAEMLRLAALSSLYVFARYLLGVSILQRDDKWQCTIKWRNGK